MTKQLTIKELESIGDIDFAKQIIQERLDKFSNTQSPLVNKLKSAKHTLNELQFFILENTAGIIDDFNTAKDAYYSKGNDKTIEKFSPATEKEDIAWDAGYYMALKQIKNVLNKTTL